MGLRLPTSAADRGRSLDRVYLLLAGGLLLHVLAGLRLLGDASEIIQRVLYAGLIWAAAISCVARLVLVPRHRGAWTAVSLALVLLAIGATLWVLAPSGASEGHAWVVSDVAFMLSYPAFYVGYLRLLRAHVRPWPASLWQDGMIVGFSLSAVGAALVLPVIEATHDGSWVDHALVLVYPIADLVLLASIGFALAITSWRPRGPWLLILLGGTVEVATDLAYQYLAVQGRWHPDSLVTSGWIAATLLISRAAWQPRARKSIDVDEHAGLTFYPAAFAAVALVVLAAGQFHEISHLAGLNALAALGFGLTRAISLTREQQRAAIASRRAAVTDPLTGLLNRRRLTEDLDDRVTTGQACLMAFLDLDGFKHYNDTFGHGAGDALLARLGTRLQEAVAGHGTAYRVGGDEFCVLIDGTTTPARATVSRAGAALSEHGERFRIRASIGVVAVPHEAETSLRALQIADSRMYAEKRQRKSVDAQAHRELAQALRDHEPHEPIRHEVGALAAATASALGLALDATADITRAAELHDVGKVAIPEEILAKPTPLSADEWRLMREHTRIGERILAAVAPALRPVGQLVLASHERWDGTGYPTGLRGEQIPLGARIIAVCDAYEAMCRPRPYSEARSQDDALAELRRCAGTQFDPRVVAAFCAVVDQAPARAARAAADAPPRARTG